MSLKRSSWLLWSTSPAQRRAAILYTRLSLRHSFSTSSSTSATVGCPAHGFCSSPLRPCGATNEPVCSLATVAMAAAPWAFIFQDWDCRAFWVMAISSVM
ncbi:hypothetical protein CRUP_037123 [Coryphaenoides rupestris]|nr:hypothetical protein CRUP_037123 [Coryphaenoides rupestris]